MCPGKIITQFQLGQGSCYTSTNPMLGCLHASGWKSFKNSLTTEFTRSNYAIDSFVAAGYPHSHHYSAGVVLVSLCGVKSRKSIVNY